MKPGTQIVYVPLHANGDINHPDCERGFVSSEHPDGKRHFCRYWRRDAWGVLRTVANSELTPNECLREHDSGPQFDVNFTLASIENGRIERWRRADWEDATTPEPAPVEE